MCLALTRIYPCCRVVAVCWRCVPVFSFAVRAQTGDAGQATYRFASSIFVFGAAGHMRGLTKSEFATLRHKRKCTTLRRFYRIVAYSSLCI